MSLNVKLFDGLTISKKIYKQSNPYNRQNKLKAIESSPTRLSLMAFIIYKNVWSLQLVGTNQEVLYRLKS